tara:strand:- start:295 stop:765 length:471 start_codon:yes stop_codon:yes gene_type:complete
MPRTKEETIAIQDAFLSAYGECGTVRTAAKAAGIHRSTMYKWEEKNLYGFKDKKFEAFQIFKEYLQDLALERVKSQSPKDNPVLLLSMMNAFIPEFNRNSKGDVSEAKELLAELKRWRKESEPVKEDAETVDAKKNAIDEVEKILSRKRESDDNSK